MRRMISPMSLRSTASGLQRTSVRSVIRSSTLPGRGRHARNRASGARYQHRSGRTHGVQRPGHDHLAVRRRDLERPRDRVAAPSRRRRSARGRDRDPPPRSRPSRIERARARRARAHQPRRDLDARARRASRAAPSRAAARRRACADRWRTPRSTRASSACAPATLCAPSSSTSGWCPTTSSRPGDRRPANASATR